MIKHIRKIFLLFFIVTCGFAYSQNSVSIPFTIDNSNLLKVKVYLNGNYSRSFIFDTGASGISINSALFESMKKAGYITPNDILGTTNVIIADGSQAQAQIVKFKSISIGGFVISNIQAFVMPDPNAPLLLGQSIFLNFGKIAIDYSRQVIILDKSGISISQNNSMNLKEIRFVPCSLGNIRVLKDLEKILSDSIKVQTFSQESNVPPPINAVSRVNSGVTIRYFDNQDYQSALKIKQLIQSNTLFSAFSVDIENMLPYFEYKSIPNYFEIWLK
jgi:hypothetical protein